MVSRSGSLVPSRYVVGEGAVFPVYAAQAPGCSIWSVPCAARGSSFQVLHKSADSVVPAFCAFPGLSSTGSQDLHRHTFPGCGAPSPLRGPSLSFRPRWSGVCTLCLGPSRRMLTIQNLRRSLVRNWRPVCSAVGAAVLGAEPAPFPSPLPRRGWACPQPASSSLDLLSPFVL